MIIKIKKILLFSFCCLLMACSGVDEYLPKDEKIQKKLTINTANKLKKEKGLVFIGWGGNGQEKCESMFLGLNYYKPLDIKKGRELLVYSIKVFLNEINSNPEIRPYLIQYPFTEKNIEIKIFVQNPKEPPENLEVVKWIRGELIYIGDKDKLLESQLRETYAQALNELAKEQKE